MLPHDGGDLREELPRTVLYCSADPNQHILSSLERHYQVKPIRSPSVLAEHSDARIDCLVVEGDRFEGLDLDHYDGSEPNSVPVIVLAERNDPALVRSVLRRPEADLVYGETVAPESSEPVSTRLCERIDDALRNESVDLDAPILELAGLLMSAVSDEVDTRIEWGLRSIGETLRANRCVLYDCSNGTLKRSYEWSTSEPLSHDTVSNTAFPGFGSSLRQFDPFVTTVDAEQDAAKQLGYDTGLFIAVPVVIDWDLEWVLSFGGVPPEVVSESTLSRLQTFAELIGHTLRRDRHLREIERQNDRLERFASVIRHDLQNPLNVIMGFADLAAETGDPADIERISIAADRMETILDDLHTLIHEADDLGERKPTALKTLLERARMTVDMADATVEIEEIGSIETHPGRLRQAFENLFRNAIEHAGEDVTVRITAIDGGFVIEDDGPGIPEAERQRIFEEGYTCGGGSGLGLSIVKTIIDAHGWEISVTDSPLGGARFEITGVRFVDNSPKATVTH